MAKQGDAQTETSAQRAFADVARARFADYRTRLAPQQRMNEQAVLKDGAQGSYARRAAEGAVNVDNAAAFGKANADAVAAAAASGKLGTSAQKLGISGMGDDQATSRALATVATGQSSDDAFIQNLKGTIALGQGQGADAVDYMSGVARVSGRQAQDDARESLGEHAALGELVGTGVGIAGGAYLGSKPDPDRNSLTGAAIRARR